MTPTTATIVIALITASPGIIALILQYKKQKAETDKTNAEKETEEADAADKIKKAALEMMGIYKAEFDDMKKKISELETKLKEIEKLLKKEMNEKHIIIKGSWILYNQVKDQGGTPKYVPPEIQEE